MNKRLKWSLIIIFIIIAIDQTVKIWVKTHMLLGESSFTDRHLMPYWAQLVFVENRGMAFGFEFPIPWGKEILTLIRLVFVIVMLVWLVKLSKRKEIPGGFIFTMALVIAGAAGNLIDSMFYGLIFSESYTIGSNMPPAHFVKFGHGYAPFLHGKVVDMFYLPLFHIRTPHWFVIAPDRWFTFFEPVFNVADSVITISIFILIFFGNKWFSIVFKTEENETDTNTTE